MSILTASIKYICTHLDVNNLTKDLNNRFFILLSCIITIVPNKTKSILFAVSIDVVNYTSPDHIAGAYCRLANVMYLMIRLHSNST